ncbi:MAG: DUF2029 domain-containing protein [Candidatus Thorarchaeota archaeon]|nr:MAG: DUF2029 domain-containing protein [Candidatus Thorarchaeota archaeon]
MVSSEVVSFQNYLKTSRLLKLGFVFNLLSLSSVMIVFAFLTLTGNLESTVYTMDFHVFYEAGQAFISSPGYIYTVSPGGLPFRYLPAFAAFMSLFAAIPLYSLYLMNIILMTAIHLFTVYMVYRVSLEIGVTTSTKNFEKTLTIVAITPPHVVNLILGQISQLVILLVLVALYVLLSSSKDTTLPFFWVGLLIGIASTLKPFCVVLIPFLVPITVVGRHRPSLSIKQLVGAFLGLLLSMVPNIVYFFTYPETFNEFLQVNFAGELSYHHSTSITRLVVALLPFVETSLLQFSVILVLGGFIFLRSYVTFVMDRSERKNYVRHFADMMFLILLVFPDSWFLFLAFLYAFLAPSMLQLYNTSHLTERESHNLDLLWHGANNLLAFFSFGIVFHYLLIGFDPINPIWVAMLYILYHRVYKVARSSVEN